MIRQVKIPDVIDHNIEYATNIAERLAPILKRIKDLPIRERAFIERYYINGETYREIAGSTNICHQRVRQIIVRGLSRLRRDVEYGRL